MMDAEMRRQAKLPTSVDVIAILLVLLALLIWRLWFGRMPSLWPIPKGALIGLIGGAVALLLLYRKGKR
jgi:ABC-type Fe3+-siderophore transport system permease subunit